MARGRFVRGEEIKRVNEQYRADQERIARLKDVAYVAARLPLTPDLVRVLANLPKDIQDELKQEAP